MVLTFSAIAGSGRRGHWCSSPRSVVTTYAAIDIKEAIPRLQEMADRMFRNDIGPWPE